MVNKLYGWSLTSSTLNTDERSLSALTKTTVAYNQDQSSRNESGREGGRRTYIQAFTAQNNICKSGVRQLGYTGLLLEVKGDVAHVRLHLAGHHCEVVVRLVSDGRIRQEADVVVGFERDDVGEEVVSGECNIQRSRTSCQSVIL
jgi:hypothetical protein